MILKRKIFLLLLLMSALLAATPSESPHKPSRIVILSSFYAGHPQTDELVSGIRQWYRNTPAVQIHCEYLDRLHFDSEEALEKQIDLLYARYHDKDISAIIACDTKTLELINGHLKRIFTNTSIVFCGENDKLPTKVGRDTRYHKIEIQNATEMLIEWAIEWKPQAENIVVISDPSIAGEEAINSIREVVSRHLAKRVYHELTGLAPDELIDRLNTFNDNSIVLALHYQYDRAGNLILPEDLRRIRTLTRIPILTNRRDLIGTLSVGGYEANLNEIGQAAAEVASHIILGHSIDTIEPVRARPVFAEDILRSYRISKSELPDQALIIRKQQSLLDFYQNYASASIYIFIVMLLGLIGTIILLLNRRKNLKILSNKERQLKLVMNSSQISLWRWIRSEDALVFDDPTARKLIVNPEMKMLKKKRWKNIVHPDSYELVIKNYTRMEHRRIDSFDIEVMLRVPKVGYQWFRIISKVTDVDRHGNVQQVHGMILNIHAQKTSQTELFKTSALMQAAIEQSPAGIVIAQAPDVRITTVNSAAANIRGMEPDEAVNVTLDEQFMKWQLYHENGDPCKPQDMPLSRAVIEGVTTHNQTMIMRDAQNQDHCIMINATPIRDKDGEITAGILIFLDVTEIRQYQQKLSENEERYHMIFDNSPLGIFHYNSKGVIVEVNEKVSELFGIEKEKLIGQNMLTISQDESIINTIRASLRGKAGYYEGDYQTILAQHRIPVRVFFSPVFDPDGIQIGGLGIAEDMSEWRRAEQALVQSEEKFRILSEKSIAGINISQDGVFKYVNPRMTELFGYTEEEMLDMPIHKIIYKDDMDHVRQNILKRMHGDTDTVVYEFRGVKKSGEIIHIQTFGSVINYRGQIAAFGTLIDITERKRAEVERIRLEKAIDQTSEAIFITDTFGTIQYVNPAFEKLNGYMRYEVIGRNAELLKGEDEENPDYNELWDSLRESRSWRGTLSNRRKNGTQYNAEATFSPIRDNNGMISQFIVVLKDVTDRVRIEKQLRQSQKMEAIGTLAGGIAHDFNNILGAILGYTELVVDDAGKGSRIHRNMQEVMSAATRAKELVAQILAFSRQKEQEKKPVNVLHIVKEVLRLLRSSTPSTIEIKRTLESNSPIVMADPTQIHQIVMNLCTNASQAMKESGGILDVHVTEQEFLEPFFARHELKPGKYVRLSIGDTGNGIPQEILERVFEPYFTTKKHEGGTGLGLAIVHGIVRNLDGDIIVTSEEGIGTEFVVYLPLIDHESSPMEPVNEPLPRGNETILFIDDEDMLIDFAQQAFERLGYDIHTFKDPREALKYYNRNKDRIDLVITDQTMPKMTGAQLATAILHENPDLPIILCTGYSETISKDRALQMGIREYIMKPLIMKEMAFIVRGILDDIT